MSAKAEKVKEDITNKHEAFYDKCNGMGREELKKELYILANYKEETEFAKAADEELKRAQDLVKEFSAPYNDALKVLKLKIAYLHLLLKDMGEQVDNA